MIVLVRIHQLDFGSEITVADTRKDNHSFPLKIAKNIDRRMRVRSARLMAGYTDQVW